jgi:hypothetical protein
MRFFVKVIWNKAEAKIGDLTIHPYKIFSGKCEPIFVCNSEAMPSRVISLRLPEWSGRKLRGARRSGISAFVLDALILHF